jgi:hypothetical protein
MCWPCMYIVIGCYQLVTNETILSWDLVQLLLDNGSLSWPVLWNYLVINVRVTNKVCEPITNLLQ